MQLRPRTGELYDNPATSNNKTKIDFSTVWDVCNLLLEFDHANAINDPVHEKLILAKLSLIIILVICVFVLCLQCLPTLRTIKILFRYIRENFFTSMLSIVLTVLIMYNSVRLLIRAAIESYQEKLEIKKQIESQLDHYETRSGSSLYQY